MVSENNFNREKKRLKINFIVSDNRMTGGMQMIVKHAEALTEKGHSVFIYTSTIPPILEKYGLSFYALYRLFRTTFRRLIEKLNKKTYFKSNNIINIPIIHNNFVRNADAIFATAWPTAYCVNRLDASKGKKFYFIQGYEKWDIKRFPKSLQRLEYSYKLPLIKMCVSKSLVELLRYKFDVESKFVWNWIDEDLYYNVEKDYNNKIKLLLVGDKGQYKGSHIAIKAYKILADKFPTVKMSIFSRQRLENLPQKCEFFYNPPRNKIVELYKQCHILISPSFLEGFGLPVLEGMASKCAVITTPVGVAHDIGIDGENLLFFEPGNFKELSQIIIMLLENRQLLKKIAGRGYVEAKRFKKSTLSSEFEQIIIESVRK